MSSYLIFGTFPFFRLRHLLEEKKEGKKKPYFIPGEEMIHPLLKENPVVPSSLSTNLALLEGRIILCVLTGKR